MSIAITAPEKFDFQDLACIEFALRLYNKEDFQLRIEPKNGEDAEIRFATMISRFWKFKLKEPISLLSPV